MTGQNLEEMLVGQNISEKEAVFIISQLCDALKPLHNADPPIICRDLKAANVMITMDKEVKIIDFDIARTYQKGQHCDTEMMGTKEYAAPEQYGFRQTDARTDIYAMGVLLNYIISGKYPVEEIVDGKLKWIIIAIVVIGIIGAAMGGNGDDSTPSAQTTDSGSKVEKEEKKIEYQQVRVDDMMTALDDNAASASEQYKGKYIEVTGKLSVIDSDSKYISLFPENNEFAIVGVQCFTKNNDQKEVVKTLSKDSSVTVKGKCTNVGEVMGYTLDIDEIVQ